MKPFLSISLLLVLALGLCGFQHGLQAIVSPSPVAAVTVVTDSFTGADTTALATHDAHWVINGGAFSLISNGVRQTATGTAHWNATFTNNQYSQAVIQAEDSGSIYIGVACRVQAAANTGYIAIQAASGSPALFLQKRVAGSDTTLASTTRITTGHTLRLECTGTTTTSLRVYDNGVLISALNFDDSSSPICSTCGAFGANYPGIAAFSTGDNGTFLDNFQADNL